MKKLKRKHTAKVCFKGSNRGHSQSLCEANAVQGNRQNRSSGLRYIVQMHLYSDEDGHYSF